MSFRTKLLAFFVTTIVAAVTLVAWGVSAYTRRALRDLTASGPTRWWRSFAVNTRSGETKLPIAFKASPMPKPLCAWPWT